MTSVSASDTPGAAKARAREIKATFLGYMAVGKSTFLTAALLASPLGRLSSSASGRALSVTEKLLKGEASYFSHPVDDRGLSRIDMLRRGEYLPKNEQGDWLRIHLALEFAGQTPFDCTTFDYTGEIATIKRMSERELRLQEHIKSSDCLYLFFDASLHQGQDEDELFAKKYQGQGEAIQRAYQAFTEAKRGWPIVIVVTKADLLFAGKSRADVSVEIRRLNGRSAEAIKEGKEVFREFLRLQGASALADVLLESRRQACVRVCFVAALGATPRQIPKPNGEPAFVIAKLADWKPLGIAETLETGMDAAIRKQIQTEIANAAGIAVRKSAPYAAVIALLAVLGFAGLDRDQRAVAAVEQQVADYDTGQGAIQAATVLEQSRRILDFGHPFVFLADRPIPFGAFPDLVDAAQVRAIERRFTVLTLADRLNNLSAGTRDLSQFLRRQESFTVMMNKLAERDQQWQTLTKDVQTTLERFEQLPGGANDVARLSNVYGPARAAFLIQAIGAVWDLANAQGIDAAAAGQQVLPYLDALKDLQVAGTGVDQAQLAAGLAADDRGRCELLFDQYQRIVARNPDKPDAQFESLAQACFNCAGDTPLRAAFCASLVNDAARWDFEEARSLYAALSRLVGPSDVTPALVQSVETYLDHARQRRLRVPDHAPAYQGKAQQFMDWHRLLARTYTFDGIAVTIKNAAPFVRIVQRPYECGSDYDKKTCYSSDAITPSGTLTLVIGGKTVVSASYSGFSTRLPVDNLWWEPGQTIELRIANDTSDQSTTLADSSAYALLNVAASGLGNSVASARFQGLSVSPLPFDPKVLVPPKPPSAGRR